METNNSGIITSTIGRHWTWGLIVLLLAALALAIVAGTGMGEAEAANSAGLEEVEAVASAETGTTCLPPADHNVAVGWGDFNKDCAITFADVQHVLQEMPQRGSGLECDLDYNGAVWLADLYIVMGQFGEVGQTPPNP